MTRRANALVATYLVLASCTTEPQHERTVDGAAWQAEAEHHYRSMVDELAARGALDTDAALESRLQRIVTGLGTANARLRPVNGNMEWEVHVAEDSRLDAIAMPGAKLLVGGPFVRRSAFTDGELAALVGHEMGHVIAGHRAIQPASGFEAGLSDELRAAEHMRANELEADAIGIELALRAGWPAAGVLSFYEKLAATSGAATFSPTHPSASDRLEHARALVEAWVRRGSVSIPH